MVKTFYLFSSALLVISCTPFDCWCQAAHIQGRPICVLSSDTETAAAGVTVYPNIDRVGDGYDVYKGNPNEVDDRGLDPGLKQSPVFEIRPNNADPTSDGQYYLTDRVKTSTNVFCSNVKTIPIRDVSEYLAVLDDSVTFEDGIPGARFSASLEYTTVSETTTGRDYQYYLSSTFCHLYEATLITLPANTQFTDEFHDHVQNLPIDPAVPFYTTYKEFITKFGTHFVKNVTMGGKYGKWYTLPTYAVATLVGKGYNMKNLATSAFELEFRFKEDDISYEIPDIHSFQGQTDNVAYNLGGNCTNSSFNDWSTTYAQNPQPLKYHLESLSSLLTSDRFPGVVNISKKKTRLEQAVLKYCDDLGLQYCCSQPPKPPPQITTVPYDNYKNAIATTWFLIPKTTSHDHKLIGTLLSCNTNWNRNPTITVNSSSAPQEVIRSTNKWTTMFVDHRNFIAYFRPQCDEGFASVSDFPARCYVNCKDSDPKTWIRDQVESNALPCISTRCLKQCVHAACSGLPDCGGITGGIRQFGANRTYDYKSFFRYRGKGYVDLDDYQCLTTVCLEGY